MTATDTAHPAPTRTVRGPMPSWRVVRDFLPGPLADELLAWAIDNEALFQPTMVGDGEAGRLDPKIRVSSSVRKFGPLKDELRRRALEAAPGLIADLRVSPLPVARAELELVAHGDGAFYGRHIDTSAGADGEGLRIVSGVYYLHRRPKGFSGGALRLYRFGGDDNDVADIEPEHNSLVVFPSWAVHEVARVSCPTTAFADSRFAVNIWIHGRRPDPVGAA